MARAAGATDAAPPPSSRDRYRPVGFGTTQSAIPAQHHPQQGVHDATHTRHWRVDSNTQTHGQMQAFQHVHAGGRQLVIPLPW